MTQQDKDIEASIASVLAEMTELRADSVTIEHHATGARARIAVQGGEHEILCELDAHGALRSARVIEL